MVSPAGQTTIGCAILSSEANWRVHCGFLCTKDEIVEVDGSQHLEGEQAEKDRQRDEYLATVDLKVLRFNSREVLAETDAVVAVIYRTMAERLNREIPLDPPLRKGMILM